MFGPLETEKSKNPHAHSDRRAGTHLSLIAGIVVALAVLMVTPTVAASPTMPLARTETAPYAGTLTNVREIITSDCGAASLTHGPKFTLSTGIGHVQANASATSAASCRTPEFPSAAEVVGALGFSTLNFTLGAGTHVVKSVWHLHWTFDLKASGAVPANSTNVQTEAVIEVYLEVFDVTLGTSFFSNQWQKEIMHYGDTSDHFVGNQNITVSISQVFNATNVYQLVALIEYGAVAGIAQGVTTGQASVGINLATNGNGATLLALKGL